MLAGRWPDAVRELTENAMIARTHNDHIWHAKALDYLLVCLLMYAWAGIDFRVSFQEILVQLFHWHVVGPILSYIDPSDPIPSNRKAEFKITESYPIR